MKKIILAILILLSINVFAQQKGISYQAVIINPNETSIPGYNVKGPLVNKDICISFQILNASSQLEYQETQNSRTDQYGMVNLVIGAGLKIGGTAANVASVTWSVGTKILVVSINTNGVCSDYTEISRQPLNYVPYSLYAEQANIADATTTVKGKIQLAGDLGGTAAAPTVPGLLSKASTVDLNAGLALKADITSLSKVATTGNYNDLTNKPIIPAVYSLPTASSSVLGGFKVGTNLSIDGNGVLSATASGNYNDLTNKPIIPAAYSLPTASSSVLGGFKVGTNLSIDGNGVLSATASGNYNDLTNKPIIPAAYSLPTASSSVLGGFKVGSNLSIDANGVLSAAASSNYNDLTNKPTIPAAYSLPTASSSVLGGFKVGSNLSIDANGVLSAASSGVPYTGATGSVDLGAYDLKVNGLTFGKGGGSQPANTSIGISSLNSNTTGGSNTANGYTALFTNTTGSANTAVGVASLYSNLTGNFNSAIGVESLTANTTGSNNTAIGDKSLFSNTTGSNNTASGYNAQNSNISGSYNTSYGVASLNSNTAGSFNTAYGSLSLKNATGISNTAIGHASLFLTTTGNNNTAIGLESLNSNTTGNENTAIGKSADVGSPNLTNATALGFGATVTSSNTIQLGNANVTAVKTSGTLTAGAVTYPSVHGTNGQYLTTTGTGTLTWTTNIPVTYTEIADEFLSVTAAQTNFTLSRTPATTTKVKMIINGVTIKGSAIILSGAVVTYNPANNGGYNITLGDEVVFYYFIN